MSNTAYCPRPRPIGAGCFLFGCLLGLSALARAQTCCTTSGGAEFGLVEPCHTAALSAQLSHRQLVASYGLDGRIHFLRDAFVSDSVLTLAGGLRLIDHRLELDALLPLQGQLRRFGTEGSARLGLGDVFLGARAMALRDPGTGIQPGAPASYVPYLDVIAGVRLPTGRSPERSVDPLGADVMGTGHVESNLGVKVTKLLTPSHLVSLSAIWGHRFARPVDGPDGTYLFAPGEQFSVRASWTYLASLRASGGLFLAVAFAGPSRRDGVRLPASDSHQLTAGGFFTWAFAYPDWELTAALTLDPLFPGAGHNVPYAGPTLALAVKRSFM